IIDILLRDALVAPNQLQHSLRTQPRARRESFAAPGLHHLAHRKAPEAWPGPKVVRRDLGRRTTDTSVHDRPWKHVLDFETRLHGVHGGERYRDAVVLRQTRYVMLGSAHEGKGPQTVTRQP